MWSPPQATYSITIGTHLSFSIDKLNKTPAMQQWNLHWTVQFGKPNAPLWCQSDLHSRFQPSQVYTVRPESKQTNIQTKMVGTKKVSQQVKAPATKPSDWARAMGQACGERELLGAVFCILHIYHGTYKRGGELARSSVGQCVLSVCQALSLISSSKRTDRNHLWLKMPKIYHLAHFRKVCYSWYSNIYLKKT